MWILEASKYKLAVYQHLAFGFQQRDPDLPSLLSLSKRSFEVSKYTGMPSKCILEAPNAKIDV